MSAINRRAQGAGLQDLPLLSSRQHETTSPHKAFTFLTTQPLKFATAQQY